MHEVLVNRLGGLSLPRKSVVRITDRPDMTLDVYRGRKTTMQQQQNITVIYNAMMSCQQFRINYRQLSIFFCPVLMSMFLRRLEEKLHNIDLLALSLLPSSAVGRRDFFLLFLACSFKI